MDEYSTEKFLEQYEHIKKLQLLNDGELNLLKKKRTNFEVAVKSTDNIKPFIDYVIFEMALMKKLKNIEYENEHDGIAIVRAIAQHIKGIFKRALRRFKDLKLWHLYIEFSKKHFPNTVSSIYKDMLAFHHSTNEYTNAVKHEMQRKNFYVAMNFLMQALNNKEDSNELIALYIECFLRQAEEADEEFKEKSLVQARKMYEKYLKETTDVSVFVDLLQKIQGIKYSIPFQNEIIESMFRFHNLPEFWNFMANRCLDGYFYCSEENLDPKNIPMETRLKNAITIYDKALNVLKNEHKKNMYEMYLNKLLDLDSLQNTSDTCKEIIVCSFEKAISTGYEDDYLPERFIINYFNLKASEKQTGQNELKDIITKESNLHPNSLIFYEIAFKYLVSIRDYAAISQLFKLACKVNEKNVKDLFKLLSYVYSINAEDKSKAIKPIMEVIESNQNAKVSGDLQAYILQYCASIDGIEKTREMFNNILNSKKVVSLSLEFFISMTEIEMSQSTPNHKIIQNCFERSTLLFGRENPQVWILYIKYCWENNKFQDAESARKRALEALKLNLKNVNTFELNYTLLKNNT